MVIIYPVQVQPPWPRNITIPSQPSTVRLQCLQDPLFWSVRLYINNSLTLLGPGEYSKLGIYITDDSQHLIINDTAVTINNTDIRCADRALTSEEAELFVIGKFIITIMFLLLLVQITNIYE